MSDQSDSVSHQELIARLRVAIAAVDVVLFRVVNNQVEVFLIPIDRPPYYTECYGLPGGIIAVDESADMAVKRHLEAKTNVSNVYIEQLHTFTDPNRDKRSRSISVSYMALMPADSAPHTREGSWYPIQALPRLAFDHADIIAVAVDRLTTKITYSTLIMHLLPPTFTLSELQNMYETILGRKLDKRNFRRKVVELGIIAPIGKQKATDYRPAELYRFVVKDISYVAII